MKNTPETIIWHGMKLVRVSDVGSEFANWLYGQTLPLVEDNDTKTDWAFYWDYERYVKGLPIVD